MFGHIGPRDAPLNDCMSTSQMRSGFLQSLRLPLESSTNLNSFAADREYGADYGALGNPKAFHHAFISTYKVFECKIEEYHDKRQCKFWHSSGDRRRNPLETPYSPIECPRAATGDCSDGDSCLRAHNMMERMFHPELYKISMCTRGPNGTLCERGDLCAFAHFPEDIRIPLSRSILNSRSSKPTTDSKEVICDKLVRLIKAHNPEGILSSELPKRYCETFGEKLEPLDDEGHRCRIKDILVHENIVVVMHKNVQPKYVYIEKSDANDCGAPSSSPLSHVGSSYDNQAGSSHTTEGGIFGDDDSHVSSSTRHVFDDSHHTYDTIETARSLPSLQSESDTSYWKYKFESAERRNVELEMMNDKLVRAYHMTQNDLRSACDTIQTKTKEINELRDCLNRANERTAVVQRSLQAEVQYLQGQLRVLQQQPQKQHTSVSSREQKYDGATSLFDPFFEEETPLCAFPECKNRGEFMCGNCQMVRYCGETHQRLEKVDMSSIYINIMLGAIGQFTNTAAAKRIRMVCNMHPYGSCSVQSYEG